MNVHRVLRLVSEPDGADEPLPGYDIVHVKSALELLRLLARDSDFDLIVGDVGTPEILRALRRRYPKIPVMILAKRPDLTAAFQAGQCGAVDYLPASMDLETLVSRMEATIRQSAIPAVPETSRLHPTKRSRRPDVEPRFLSARDLTIDRHRRVALFHGRRLELTRSEFDILSYLVENKGRVLLFEELAFMLQRKYLRHEEARRSLSAHMTYLRDALKKAGCLNYILNIRGRGYVIESNVEEMLRQSETRLQFLLQQIPAVIWSADRDGRVTWIGGAGLAELNLTPDDVIGMAAQGLVGAEGDAGAPDVLASQRALRGEPVRYEGQLLDITFEVRLEPLRDAQGNIEGTIGIALNISERKRAEEALRRSEKLYHTLVSNLPDSAVYLFDHDLRFLLAGGAALERSGFSSEQVKGQTLYDIASPHVLAVLELHYRAALAGSESIFELPVRDRIYVVHTLPVRNGNSNVFAGMVVAQDITERKRADERLRASEERYRIISGMMSDYVYAADVLPDDPYNTEVKWVAGALTRITGFTQQEVKAGMRWDQLVHPDDWPIIEKRRLALLAGQQDTSEFRITGKHGRSYWVRTYTYPLWDDREGRVVSIYAAVKDITAWKEAEQALVQERNLLQTILETVPDQIYVKDLNSRFVLANPKTWQLHNLSDSSDLLGKTDRDIFGEDGEADLRAEAHLFATGQPIVNEERFTPEALGGPRWSLVTKAPLYGSDRTIIGLVGVNRDITERKRIEEALRQSEANIRKIIENAPAPILIFQGTKVVFVNAAIEALTDYSRDEWLTMNYYDVIHPDMRAAAIERGWKRQRGEPVRSRYEVKIIRKNGEERWIDYMATLIQYEGQPAVLAIVADITERKTMEAMLREIEADLRGLIASTPAPMLIFQDTSIRFVNPAAGALVGYSQEELQRMTFWEVIHPDMRELVRERGMQHQPGQPAPPRYEVKLLTKSGEVRWVDYMGTVIQYEGKPAVLGIVFDITDRKQVEAALRESEERLRIVLENMPVMVDAFDEQINIVFWNRECERVSGYSAEEIAGNPGAMQLLYPNPTYLSENLAEWERRGDDFRDWEMDMTTRDGSTKTIAWSNISARFPVPGWKTWGIGVDVTARRQAEQALRQTEERLRMVISHAPIYLWAINKDGIFTLAEGQALEALGLSPGEPVGRSIFDANRDRPDLQRHIHRALRGELFSAYVEPVEGVFFETRYIPMLDETGGVAGVLGISVDVTGQYPSTAINGRT
jgi:PAS domain S-box-containing protein